MNDIKNIKNYLISGDKDVSTVMSIIDKGAKGIVFVTDDSGKLIGSVTDGDIRRWLMNTSDLSSCAEHFMKKDPKFIKELDNANAESFMIKNSITAVPVVDANQVVIDIIFLRNTSKTEIAVYNSSLENIPVVIMAGGKGTRLYPYTKILPKPLIPIGDVPILERIINRFFEYGAKDFYISVNYKKNMIKSYFEEIQHDYVLNYIDEDLPLGTCGSIKLIEKEFNSPFVVTNCDTLIDVDFSELIKFHYSQNNLVTVVAALKNTVIPYGVFETTDNGKIKSITEKPVISNLINTGMYIVNPDLISLIPDRQMFHMTDLLEKVMEFSDKVGLFPIGEEEFLDMGEFAEMKRMEEKLSLVKD